MNDMTTRPAIPLLMIAVCVAAASACGGELSITEYAAQAEALVAEMEADFAEIDATWEAQQPTKDGALRYWEERLQIRDEFLEGVESLKPPAEVADQHAAALDVFGRITEADRALAARVAALDDVTAHREWLETAEGQTSLAVLEDVYAFCRASQADYDETAEREPLGDVPFIPPELKQVVSVAFGCPPPDSP